MKRPRASFVLHAVSGLRAHLKLLGERSKLGLCAEGPFAAADSQSCYARGFPDSKTIWVDRALRPDHHKSIVRG